MKDFWMVNFLPEFISLIWQVVTFIPTILESEKLSISKPRCMRRVFKRPWSKDRNVLQLQILSKCGFGLRTLWSNGYTPVTLNPAKIFDIVMALAHAFENSLLKLKRVTTWSGWDVMNWRYSSRQNILRGPKQPLSKGWVRCEVAGKKPWPFLPQRHEPNQGYNG